MLAYKIMRSRHYIQGGKVLTSRASYGNRIFKDKPTTDLIREVIRLSKEHRESFRNILLMLIDLQANKLQPAIPDKIPRARAVQLNCLAKAARKIHSDTFSATFWEILYEDTRRIERPKCPTRLKSYFACNDIASLRQYRDAHWSNRMSDKIACEINTKNCKVAFEADMTILDDITEEMNFENARPHILRYWDQEESSTPIVELLLQGSVVLGKQIQI